MVKFLQPVNPKKEMLEPDLKKLSARVGYKAKGGRMEPWGGISIADA